MAREAAMNTRAMERVTSRTLALLTRLRAPDITEEASFALGPDGLAARHTAYFCCRILSRNGLSVRSLRGSVGTSTSYSTPGYIFCCYSLGPRDTGPCRPDRPPTHAVLCRSSGAGSLDESILRLAVPSVTLRGYLDATARDAPDLLALPFTLLVCPPSPGLLSELLPLDYLLGFTRDWV
ncbi:hypothetical protein OH77DRAFT_1172015 [Trametes cingulata]|nr:hypothetical protein OH77DRAFT_1172015 [Trametes cingulata]